MNHANSWLGREFELDVGPIAHGGHCVARVGGEHGRVIFVRHTLPGERVRARVTEDLGGAFCRADAVEVLVASTDRVPRPCPFSGPGRCGGCDFQHVDPPAQRRLKAAVVAEQLHRLGGVDVGVQVEALPGGALGWRTRVAYATAPDGRLGLRRHRSHHVEVVDHCPIGAAGVGDGPELSRNWPDTSAVEVVAGSDERAVLVTPTAAAPGRPNRSAGRRSGRHDRGRRPSAREPQQVTGPDRLPHKVLGRTFTVTASGFWQVHPAAATTFVTTALELLRPRPGERAVDLYAGAGLFSAFLAETVGPTGAVVGLEGSRPAVADAALNLAGTPWAEVRHGAVTAAAVTELGPADVVVLDPPRSGVGRAVLAAVLDLGPRAVAYVACDPAAFARDVATACELGWALADLRAFDSFPMTQHVECVGLLVPQRPDVSLPPS